MGISKILFDLNGLDPPRGEPFSSQESFITLETTLLGCVHPQLCRHSPFCFQISRNYKKQLYFFWATYPTPRKKRKTHHLPFSASFSLNFQHRLSLSLSLTALSLMKEAFESFSGGYTNIYLVPLCLKKGLKSELSANVCQGMSIQHLSDFVFSEMESVAGAGLYLRPRLFFLSAAPPGV